MATYRELVQHLSHRDVGIRMLALAQLVELTGRDPLEYDPDHPDVGPGLRAWQDLKRGELRPAGAARTSRGR